MITIKKGSLFPTPFPYIYVIYSTFANDALFKCF